MEPARPDQQFDQPRIGFCCRKRLGPVDQHRNLPPGTAQLYRHREDLGFVRRAWQWPRRDIQQRREPCWAEMDVDPIGFDVDAFDQGGNERVLARCGQLGPALPDVLGSRNQPTSASAYPRNFTPPDPNGCAFCCSTRSARSSATPARPSCAAPKRSPVLSPTRREPHSLSTAQP